MWRFSDKAVGAWSMALLIAVGIGGCKVVEGPEGNEIFDAPLEGLTPAQTDLHIVGDEEFGRVFAPEDGLGPVYNGASCDQCHPGEAKGHPNFNLTRFGRQEAEGFSPMIAHGGPQLQDRAIPGFPAERLPDEATGATELTPPAITGLGFVEAVDDATLMELADPEDADGDGISGRVQLIEPTPAIEAIVAASRAGRLEEAGRLQRHDGKYVGRFGWKAGSVDLRHQTVNAYAEDMGITTRFRPRDRANVQRVGPASEDAVPDPEVPTSTVSNVVFYLKTLRPPRRRGPQEADVRAGEAVFGEIGCAECHHPTMRTGNSPIDELSNKTFHPYSDFLLHDMGEQLDDGYTEGRAETSEWRTPPLWGLGLADDFQGGTPRLMHDGRAGSIARAIELHGGEAAESRTVFRGLSEARRQKLLVFLNSL